IGELAVNNKIVGGSFETLLSWPGAGDRQLKGGNLPELPSPVREVRFDFRRRGAFSLPGRIIAELNRQVQQFRLSSLAQGAVNAQDFLDDQLSRPAIGNDVMHGEQEDMVIVGD